MGDVRGSTTAGRGALCTVHGGGGVQVARAQQSLAVACTFEVPLQTHERAGPGSWKSCGDSVRRLSVSISSSFSLTASTTREPHWCSAALLMGCKLLWRLIKFDNSMCRRTWWLM